MVSNLFVNGCILVSIIFVAVTFLESDRIKKLPLLYKDIISGVCFSISSIFLMKYKITVTETAFLDFRAISQSSSAFYGGPISSIVTGLISALFRIFYFGVNKDSVLTFISMIVSSLVCAYISKREHNKKIRCALLIISSKFIHIVLLALVIDSSDLVRVLITLYIGSIFVATAVYYVFDHLSLAFKQVEMLKIQADIDFLTGVNNARSFDRLYQKSLNTLLEENKGFSVLMIDIDFFKKVNDTYGHFAGDKVLREMGYILSVFCTDNCKVGRVGGEEFCILLKEYSNEDAIAFGERLRKHIEELLFIIDSQIQIKITVSIGVSTYNSSVFHMEDVREIADQNLYECKKTGRNKVCY